MISYDIIKTKMRSRRAKTVFKTREQAKSAFSKMRARAKYPYLTFEEYEQYFSDPGISFVDIGRMSGIPKPSITRLYQDYFAPILSTSWVGGLERQSLRMRMKDTIPIESDQQKAFIELVRKRCPGIAIRALSRQEKKALPRTSCERCFYIEGRRCYVSHTVLRAPSDHQRAKIFRTSARLATLSDVEFMVLIGSMPERDPEIFIIPCSHILQGAPSFPLMKGGASKYIYIAYEYNIGNKEYPMWQYLDAWHLIKSSITAEP